MEMIHLQHLQIHLYINIIYYYFGESKCNRFLKKKQGNKSDKERKIVRKELSFMHTKRLNIRWL